ncbi:MAG: ATP-binding protein [Actinobacteria bacterium]|nr:ATP-binding protein [Actinomycetota bacterium]MCA1806331.1 ATP-binding protein [Actinomycetota bacterium]
MADIQTSTPTPAPTQPPKPPPRPKPLAFQIRSTKRPQRWFKGLFYGNYGTGKTTLASTAQDVPEMRDVLFIDAEAGDTSLSHRDDIDTITIANYGQFARVFEFLRLHCKARDEGDLATLGKLEAHFKGLDAPVPPKEVRKYNTVVIDSITEVQKYCMYQLLGVNVGEYELDAEPTQAQFAEWGKSAEMIRLLVRSFRNLPMHVIIVAAENTVEDETKKQIKSPALPGKLSKEIQGFLDVVGYLVASRADAEGGIKRRVWLEPGKTFDAKSRLQWLKVAYIDDPTMAMIMGHEEIVEAEVPRKGRK